MKIRTDHIHDLLKGEAELEHNSIGLICHLRQNIPTIHELSMKLTVYFQDIGEITNVVVHRSLQFVVVGHEVVDQSSFLWSAYHTFVHFQSRNYVN